MEEGKASSLSLPVYHNLSQLIILLEDNRQVFLADRIRIRILTDYRLDRNLLKTKFRKLQPTI